MSAEERGDGDRMAQQQDLAATRSDHDNHRLPNAALLGQQNNNNNDDDDEDNNGEEGSKESAKNQSSSKERKDLNVDPDSGEDKDEQKDTSSMEKEAKKIFAHESKHNDGKQEEQGVSKQRSPVVGSPHKSRTHEQRHKELARKSSTTKRNDTTTTGTLLTMQEDMPSSYFAVASAKKKNKSSTTTPSSHIIATPGCRAGTKALKPFRPVATCVVMLDMETDKIVRVFSSMRQAERDMNVDRKHLRVALDPQPDGRPGVADGYRWRLKEPEDDKEIAALSSSSSSSLLAVRSKTAAVSSAKKAPAATTTSAKKARTAASGKQDKMGSSAIVTTKKAKSTLGANATAHWDALHSVASPLDMEKVAGGVGGVHDWSGYANKKRDPSKPGSMLNAGSLSEDVEHSESSSGVTEDEEEGPSNKQYDLPAIKQGRLEFTLNGSLQAQLICELCMGYFREPYRITTCMHCFCKSCLLLALERAGHQCPSCQVYLGRLANSNEIPFKPDRLLHDLMDKVLFPELAAADDEAEADFYASLGIQKKAEFRQVKKKDGTTDDTVNNTPKARFISFQLVPTSGTFSGNPATPSLSSSAAPLQRPFLETESSLSVSQLKKYLQQQEHKSVTDLYCLGTVLGNEWSIDFVWKTIWKRQYVSEDRLLSLEYR